MMAWRPSFESKCWTLLKVNHTVALVLLRRVFIVFIVSFRLERMTAEYESTNSVRSPRALHYIFITFSLHYIYSIFTLHLHSITQIVQNQIA